MTATVQWDISVSTSQCIDDYTPYVLSFRFVSSPTSAQCCWSNVDYYDEIETKVFVFTQRHFLLWCSLPHTNRLTNATFFSRELKMLMLWVFCVSIFQHLDIVSPFQLYFNPTLIVLHYQLWRLVTTFLFFGTIGFNFLFNMTFTYRYCRMLEEGSFRGKSSDFIMMFLFGGAIMSVSNWN